MRSIESVTKKLYHETRRHNNHLASAESPHVPMSTQQKAPVLWRLILPPSHGLFLASSHDDSEIDAGRFSEHISTSLKSSWVGHSASIRCTEGWSGDRTVWRVLSGMIPTQASKMPVLPPVYGVQKSASLQFCLIFPKRNQGCPIRENICNLNDWISKHA